MSNEIGLALLSTKVTTWASQKRHISTVHFFGSRVRGDHHPDSDIDIAVALNQTDPDDAFAYFASQQQVWHDELRELLCPLVIDLEWSHPTATPTIALALSESSITVFSMR